MIKVERDMRAPVIRYVEAMGFKVVCEMWFSDGICDIIAAKFGDRPNRFIPPLESCIAIELKMTDIAGVLRQSIANQYKAIGSYAVMPKTVIDKMRVYSFDKFSKASVGLLSVDEEGEVVEVIRPTKGHKTPDVERKKIWRHISRKDYADRLAYWKHDPAFEERQ